MNAVNPIFRRDNLPRILLVLAVGIGLAGCGGGSSNPTATVADTNTGRLTLSLKFPQAVTGKSAKPVSRIAAASGGVPIPIGTQAVLIVINNALTGQAVTTPRLIPAPPANQTNPTVTLIVNLPPALIQVTATCHPDLSAAQLPLATGTAEGQIRSGAATTITVPLALTADHITVTPNPVLLNGSGDASSVTAQVFNKANQQVNFPLTFTSADTTSVAVVQSSSDQTMAVLTAQQGFSSPAVVTVTEPNSGLTTTINVIGTGSSN